MFMGQQWAGSMNLLSDIKPDTDFKIDIESCERCGRKVKVMASIEAPAVIVPILKHLQQKQALKADIQPPELAP